METYLITPESLAVLGHLIPEEYRQEIVSDRMMGIVIVDMMRDNDIVGVVLFREKNNWMEIVWVCLSEPYRGADSLAELLRFCTEAAHKDGKVWGAFADLPVGGRLEEVLKDSFQDAGFVLVPVEHHCYTATLRTIRESPFFERMVQNTASPNIVSLKEAKDSLKNRLVVTVKESTEPVPLPVPLDLSYYNQKLSCIHCVNNVTPDAFLFVSDKKDHLTLECAWAEDPNALLTLIGHIFKEADAVYPEDTNILIPTVTEKSARLAEKMIPGAEQMTGTQARLYFF